MFESINNPILEPTNTVSEGFRAIAAKIRLEGTPVNAWKIESKRFEDSTAAWQDEESYTVTDVSVDFTGVAELLYRVNLGATNTAVSVFVYERQDVTRIWA